MSASERATRIRALMLAATPLPWTVRAGWEQEDPGTYVTADVNETRALVLSPETAPSPADAEYLVTAANELPEILMDLDLHADTCAELARARETIRRLNERATKAEGRALRLARYVLAGSGATLPEEILAVTLAAEVREEADRRSRG